jgi:hypothetical protein
LLEINSGNVPQRAKYVQGPVFSPNPHHWKKKKKRKRRQFCLPPHSKDFEELSQSKITTANVYRAFSKF